MVNKTRISGVIATAKKSLFKSLTINWEKPDLGFDQDKFPPEKTIYLSLLRETGIHRIIQGRHSLTEPKESSFQPIWQASVNFLEGSRNCKRNLQELIDTLGARPYKLKKGLLDFWLPLFLFIKRDDYALFANDTYVPYITDDTLDLISRNPKDFDIKAFDIEGVRLDIFNRYREVLNQSHTDKPSSSSFIETVRPFLVFYRDLPLYVKETKTLGKKAQLLRQAIAKSKDPEEAFYELFPQALGTTILELQTNQKVLEKFVHEFKECIREIRSCYDKLLTDFETFIRNEIIGDNLKFPFYKQNLQKRFSSIKIHLLNPKQKTFIQRINSELDDSKSWLNSIAQACIGKPLDVFTDNDTIQLYDSFKEIVHELDNLCELSKADFIESNEIIFKLEVTSFVEGLQKNLVRLPKSKNNQLIKLQNKIESTLTGDRQLDIATLAKVLEDILRNER